MRGCALETGRLQIKGNELNSKLAVQNEGKSFVIVSFPLRRWLVSEKIVSREKDIENSRNHIERVVRCSTTSSSMANEALLFSPVL